MQFAIWEVKLGMVNSLSIITLVFCDICTKDAYSHWKKKYMYCTKVTWVKVGFKFRLVPTKLLQLL